MKDIYYIIGRFVVFLLVITVISIILTGIELILGIKFPTAFAQIIYKIIIVLWGFAIYISWHTFLK